MMVMWTSYDVNYKLMTEIMPAFGSHSEQWTSGKSIPEILWFEGVKPSRPNAWGVQAAVH